MKNTIDLITGRCLLILSIMMWDKSTIEQPIGSLRPDGCPRKQWTKWSIPHGRSRRVMTWVLHLRHEPRLCTLICTTGVTFSLRVQESYKESQKGNVKVEAWKYYSRFVGSTEVVSIAYWKSSWTGRIAGPKETVWFLIIYWLLMKVFIP